MEDVNIPWTILKKKLPLRSVEECKKRYAILLERGDVVDRRYRVVKHGLQWIGEEEDLKGGGNFVVFNIPVIDGPIVELVPPRQDTTVTTGMADESQLGAVDDDFETQPPAASLQQQGREKRVRRAVSASLCDDCGGPRKVHETLCESCQIQERLAKKAKKKKSKVEAATTTTTTKERKKSAPPPVYIPPAEASNVVRPKVLHGDEAIICVSAERSAVAQHLMEVGVCTMCGSPEDCAEDVLLCCCNCGHFYHWFCLGMHTAPLLDDGEGHSWRCPSCKWCEVCHSTGHASHLLMCEKCDRGYHTFCLNPPLSFVPHGDWFCPQHVECHSCGGHSAGTLPEHVWHDNNTLCHLCWEWMRQGHQCPSCLKAYDPNNWKAVEMVGCDCGKWVHVGCDRISGALYKALNSKEWSEEPFACVHCRREQGKPQLVSQRLIDLLLPENKVEELTAAPAPAPVEAIAAAAAAREALSPCVDDGRDWPTCAFCQRAPSVVSLGRLIPVPSSGCDTWVHAGCAIWSPGVTWKKDGTLVGVSEALERAKPLVCQHCSRTGASISCKQRPCITSYHLPCIMEARIPLHQRGAFSCPAHHVVMGGGGGGASGSAAASSWEVGFCKPIFVLNRVEKPATSAAPANKALFVERTWEDALKGFIYKNNPSAFLNQQFEDTHHRRRQAEVQEDMALIRFRDSVAAGHQMQRGSLKVVSFGRIKSSPFAFHSNRYIFPVGFVAKRRFWSYMAPDTLIEYTHSIEENGDKPRFCILASDDPDHRMEADTMEQCWDLLTTRLDVAATARGSSNVRGHGDMAWKEDMFGFPAWVVAAIEAMPEASDCGAYNFQFWKRTQTAAAGGRGRDVEHPLGCARAIPYSHTQGRGFKEASGTFVYSRVAVTTTKGVTTPGSSSRARGSRPNGAGFGGSGGGGGGAGNGSSVGAGGHAAGGDYEKDTPDFVRYRNLTLHPPQLVVHKSRIHGMGVYTLTPIKRNDMVIEYQGEIVRPVVADVREKDYERRGIPCYFWKLDEKRIVDATEKGNMARFINHCHDPNCVVDIVSVSGNPIVMVQAKRDIIAGEELTYDYMFDIPDDNIVCDCGAVNCPGFMNKAPLF